jgi:hypothetical protein
LVRGDGTDLAINGFVFAGLDKRRLLGGGVRTVNTKVSESAVCPGSGDDGMEVGAGRARIGTEEWIEMRGGRKMDERIEIRKLSVSH